jgi:transposase
MRKVYPSDISREQFEIIREDLESVKKSTKPREYDLYDIFCAICYVLKSGCQWRMLPSDFPKWEATYYYFTVWSSKYNNEESLFEGVLKKIGILNSYIKWQRRNDEFLHN